MVIYMIKKLIVSNLKEDKQHILFGICIALVLVIGSISGAMQSYQQNGFTLSVESLPQRMTTISFIAIAFSIYVIHNRFGYLLDKNKQEFYKAFPIEKKDLFLANYLTVVIEVLCILLMNVALIVAYDLLMNTFDLIVLKVFIVNVTCVFTIFHLILSLVIVCKNKGIFYVNTIMMFMV